MGDKVQAHCCAYRTEHLSDPGSLRAANQAFVQLLSHSLELIDGSALKLECLRDQNMVDNCGYCTDR